MEDAGASPLDRAAPVTLFTRVYGVDSTPEGGRPKDLGLEATLSPAGGGESRIPPAKILYFRPAAAGAGAFDAVLALDLSAIPAGAWELQVDARDRGGSATARKTRAITLR